MAKTRWASSYQNYKRGSMTASEIAIKNFAKHLNFFSVRLSLTMRKRGHLTRYPTANNAK